LALSEDFIDMHTCLTFIQALKIFRVEIYFSG